MEGYYLKRFVTYRPQIDSFVNQEVSFKGSADGDSEYSVTCTGIKDSCKDCFIVQIGDSNNGRN
ncbi:hypothetical protein DFO73_1097 [Cytobacillus oceanisediminis]|jgi:hypothetical protein|uniref:Uncharacterized protein n=1 Tax=Cytobacillus oceanisediminis TaxID=665099 RepID=A0A2V2ZS75_9BACI|nr:hypothetical protein [Cytobacillus oceanisediminis]PWW26844.1 hypothetical protein DFO73_1097 [Cytobacillus oceanisediminis]